MIRNKIDYRKKRQELSFSSLRLKMVGALLFGVSLALLLLIVVNLLTRRYIETDYLSDESKSERAEEYLADLQRYVTENGLTVDDASKIAAWAKNNKYIYVLIYKDDQLLFESGKYDDYGASGMEENKDNDAQKPGNSVENGENDDKTPTDDNNSGGSADTDDGEEQGGAADDDNTSDTDGDSGADSSDGQSGASKPEDADKDDDTAKNDGAQYPSQGITVRPPSRDELIANAQQNGSHPIYTADDGVLLASMVDYTEYLYYDLANIASWIVALLAFIITMWFHFYGITKRISKLGKEVTVVAEGDMNHPIAAVGNDEITRLSMDVEYMRTSMLDNVQRQHSALESNRELITAMSHDIRTPLTVLLGYLEIMKLNAPDGEMKNYIEASEKTAMRLKKMSDDMFGYFLAYGGDIEIDIQECNARTMVEQMISGLVFLLREQGYTIEYNFENEDAEFLDDVVMVTDPPQLMRIVENIFSNVMKYADPESVVSIYVGAETDEMTIKVSNTVSKNPDEAQKNGIGLRSCMKLANAMDIRFSSDEEGGIFTSSLYVPIIANIDYSDVEAENEKGGFAQWLSSVSEKFKQTASKAWKWLCDLPARIKKK